MRFIFSRNFCRLGKRAEQLTFSRNFYKTEKVKLYFFIHTKNVVKWYDFACFSCFKINAHNIMISRFFFFLINNAEFTA